MEHMKTTYINTYARLIDTFRKELQGLQPFKGALSEANQTLMNSALVSIKKFDDYRDYFGKLEVKAKTKEELKIKGVTYKILDLAETAKGNMTSRVCRVKAKMFELQDATEGNVPFQTIWKCIKPMRFQFS